jgi:hypothetical protein
MKSYLNIGYVLERKSFPLFLAALNNFVDMKEWSEVGGVYNICRKIMHKHSPDVIYDIGCGKRPTLALMMALNYKVPVHAIDPQLDLSNCKSINRLYMYNLKLKQFIEMSDFKDYNNALVLANHSHASMREVTELLSKFKEWTYLTVPCCIDNRLNNKSGVHYKDIHMHSDKNSVFIYSKSNEAIASIMAQ